MPSQIQRGAGLRENEFESLLIKLFQQAGWHVREQPSPDRAVDIVVESGGKKYAIELKRSSEGRRDRLIPLLSQAILQAKAAAHRLSESAVPVAIVASRYIPDSVAENAQEFAASNAPDVGVGVIDSEGLRAFHGFGLEKFNSKRAVNPQFKSAVQSDSSGYLFSDLNQWMIKILLGAHLPESLMSVPRSQFGSGRQLAQAAGVSVMSASRLIRHLSREGFLEEWKGSLSLVRIEELMRRWLGASQRSIREVPVRWIIRGGADQFLSAIRSYSSWMELRASRPSKLQVGQPIESAPRICIGLFAAADLLGFGFVRGVPPHIYLERLDPNALERLGLSLEAAEGRADAYIRIPGNSVAVFRPAVRQEAVPVADIIQVWLDVSNYPARGKEQAEQIWKRALAPSFHGKPR
jgi:hypothetical protein